MMRNDWHWHYLLTAPILRNDIVTNAANRLDYQVDENGFFPKEMERTISLHYTALQWMHFLLLLQMSEKTEFDFWNLTTPSGKSLKKCFDVLKPISANEKKWEGEQIKAL